jgi:phospholipid-binding lipoprotein MlaA
MHSAALKVGALAAAISAGVVGGCTTTGGSPGDPFEISNRRYYAFNEQVDKAVLIPVARGYRAVTNEPIREGVSNFLSNLSSPITFTNEVLQGKIGNAAGTAGRLVINTTVGVAGVFDPAGWMGIERTREDFGQTLGVYGVPPGPYLVLPFLGSTSPRDLAGFGVDRALDPLNYTQFDGDDALRIGSTALRAASGREGVLETVDDLRRTQVDPYVTLRQVYVRNRAAAVGKRENAPDSGLEVPDFERDF